VESFLADVGYACRGMRKNPGFTAAAVTMLALGIGINAAVFTVTKAALFAGFPLVDRNDRLVYISHRGCCVSYPDFEDWRAQATSFEGMALVHGVQRILSDESGFPERYDATEVTANTFALVGQRPMLGRDFAASDETPGAAPVAILSHDFWERRWGRNPAILGQTVRINGAPTTVIGIMPEGVTLQSARAEMDTIGRRLESDYPLTNQSLLPQVQTFREFFIVENEDAIYISM